MKCWGRNNNGQLGNGGGGLDMYQDLPVAVRNSTHTGDLNGVTTIAAGFDHTCAILDTGTAQCWGDNNDGELGNGTNTNSNLPVTVRNDTNTGDLAGVTAITVGRDHTCATLDDSTARCWGYNLWGQSGNGTNTNSNLPVAVRNSTNTGALNGVTAIVADMNHTCATLDDSTARCWGYNYGGQLGNGTNTNSNLPVAVRNSTNTGALGGIGGIVTVGPSTCVTLDDNTARCWGGNWLGQLGNGTASDSSLPVTVRNSTNTGDLAGVTALTAGDFHVCATLDDGSAQCWGYNSDGRLGNGTTTNSSLPVTVRNSTNTGDLAGVTALTAGSYHACAILSDATAQCWGDNSSGQLGNGATNNSNLPVTVLGLG